MSETIRTRQEPLFVESLEDAMEAVAAVCGGKKKFASLLRPDLEDEPEKAHRWLLDCLNHDRRAAFHIEHFRRAIVAARDADCHILKHWFDDRTGYSRTPVAPIKTERQQVAELYQAKANELKQLADRLAAIDHKETMAEVRELRR